MFLFCWLSTCCKLNFFITGLQSLALWYFPFIFEKDKLFRRFNHDQRRCRGLIIIHIALIFDISFSSTCGLKMEHLVYIILEQAPKHTQDRFRSYHRRGARLAGRSSRCEVRKWCPSYWLVIQHTRGRAYGYGSCDWGHTYMTGDGGAIGILVSGYRWGFYEERTGSGECIGWAARNLFSSYNCADNDYSVQWAALVYILWLITNVWVFPILKGAWNKKRIPYRLLAIIFFVCSQNFLFPQTVVNTIR